MYTSEETYHDDYDFDDNDGFDYEDAEIELHEFLFSEYLHSGGKPVYDLIRKGHVLNARLAYDRAERIWELQKRESGGEWYTISCCRRGLYGKKAPPGFLNDCLGVLNLSHLRELADRICEPSE